MSRELACLVWAGLLSLTLALTTVAIHFRAFGGKTIRGNRDGYPPLSGLSARVVRAHVSLNEALLPFAIVTFAAVALHVSTNCTFAAAAAFLAARTAHACFYLLGITPWRSVSFYAGLLATAAYAAQLPLLG